MPFLLQELQSIADGFGRIGRKSLWPWPNEVFLVPGVNNYVALGHQVFDPFPISHGVVSAITMQEYHHLR